MKYSSIKVSWDPKVIGIKNGIYQMEIDENCFNTKDELNDFCSSLEDDNFHNVFSRINGKPIQMRLLKDARVTDFMGFSPNILHMSFAISKSVLSVFEGFKLKDHGCLNVSFSNLKIGERFLFWYPFTEFSSVDFTQSIVYTGDEIIGDKEYHSIRTCDEFVEFKKLNPLSYFEKIVLHESEYEFDLIYFRGGGDFVSDKLRRAIEDNNLTGVIFNGKWDPVLEMPSR